ncbi:MAG: RluA family pseudouridine synthase [Fusobacteria bacterium]|nr:RluA family pseudouridine synthase [Fusobacteriota bacterium]
MPKYIIEKEHSGITVKEYLKDIKGYSSRSMNKIDIFLNKKKVKIDKIVKYRNVLNVVEKEKETNIIAKKLELDIIYEDENLILINKPPFLLTHPTKKKVDITLANGLLNYFNEKNINSVPRFYNRLDMNTSGIIIAAKTGFGQAFLQNKGEVKKYYKAFVKGIIKEQEIIIEDKIGISEDGIKRIIDPNGQDAKTKVKIIKTYEKNNITQVELELFTGRTHQIRVHLSNIGHPIIGDELYGGEYKDIKRQLLHSYKVIYIDPRLNQKKEFEIELFSDMKLFEKSL